MRTDETKEVYGQEARTIEYVTAQAWNRGLIRLRVREVRKVRAVAL